MTMRGEHDRLQASFLAGLRFLTPTALCSSWVEIAANSASGGDYLLADAIDATSPTEAQFVRVMIDQSGCSVSNHARVFEIEVYACVGGGAGGWTSAGNTCFGSGGPSSGSADGGVYRGDDAYGSFSIPIDATAIKLVRNGGVGVSCSKPASRVRSRIACCRSAAIASTHWRSSPTLAGCFTSSVAKGPCHADDDLKSSASYRRAGRRTTAHLALMPIGVNVATEFSG